MNKKQLLILAKTFSTYDPRLFKTEERFKDVSGYRVHEHNGVRHLVFTNRRIIADFLIEEGREEQILSWFKEAGIPEMKCCENSQASIDNLLAEAETSKDLPEKKAIDFITVSKSKCEGLKMPTGEILENRLVSLVLSFLDEAVYYRMCTPSHMLIHSYDSDFVLHIGVRKTNPEDWKLEELYSKRKEKEEESTGAGLFF